MAKQVVESEGRTKLTLYGLQGGTKRAMARRDSGLDRVLAAEQLMLGLPPGITIEGARKMERVVAYLYQFRAATLGQLVRCLQGEPDAKVRRWLKVYPYIGHGTAVVKRYDVERGEWIRANKLGVYTLTREGLLLYERANGYEAAGYSKKGKKIDHKPNDVENTLNAIELFTRVREVDSTLEWISNEWMATKLRHDNIMSEQERLSTTGFIEVGDENPEYWGVTAYVNSTSAVGRNTTKTFRPEYYGEFGGITLVRDDHVGPAVKVTYKHHSSERADERAGYFRFVPYEFSLHHPKWFAGLLHGNRWSVFEPYFAYVRSMGGTVEKGSHRDEQFHWRVVNGQGEVEYVDTTYGATFTELIALLSNKGRHEQAPHTLYVVNQKEAQFCEDIATQERVFGLNFRVIDWPGGK